MAMHPFCSRRKFFHSGLGLIGAATLPRFAFGSDMPRRGGTLIVAADTEPRNLNPAIVASNGVFYVASKVLEPLAEASYQGEGLSPRLATSWVDSKDGLSIAFSLREGVTWHDGKPFTSADVAFSALEVWKKFQNLGREVFENLESVETPDAKTAIFHFSKPTPFQLIKNALPALTSVVPRHRYEGTDILANPANQKLIGTGPFRFAEYRPGEFYKLERNPNYWEKDRPYLDAIIYRILPDKGAIAAALEAGEIHLAAFSAVPLADLERISKAPGIFIKSQGYEGLTYQLTVEINHRRKELSDARVRRAISLAIDRKFVVDTIFLTYAQASTGPIPKLDKQFYVANKKMADFNPAEANALLDEAGYPRKANGIRFSVKLLPAPWFEETRQFGDYLRQALKVVGIEAGIVSYDPAGHQKAVYTDHNFDLAIGSPVYRNDPAISTTILYQSGIPAGVPFSNQYGYQNPAVDSIISKAAIAVDGDERIKPYQEFQWLVAEDQPIINVAEFSFVTVARIAVRNLANNPRWATSHWADTWLDK